MNERTYRTIKWVLKYQIDKGRNLVWYYKDNTFTCVYNKEPNGIKVYTAKQLLKKLNESPDSI
mgnify:FL=1